MVANGRMEAIVHSNTSPKKFHAFKHTGCTQRHDFACCRYDDKDVHAQWQTKWLQKHIWHVNLSYATFKVVFMYARNTCDSTNIACIPACCAPPKYIYNTCDQKKGSSPCSLLLSMWALLLCPKFEWQNCFPVPYGSMRATNFQSQQTSLTKTLFLQIMPEEDNIGKIESPYCSWQY